MDNHLKSSANRQTAANKQGNLKSLPESSPHPPRIHLKIEHALIRKVIAELGLKVICEIYRKLYLFNLINKANESFV